MSAVNFTYLIELIYQSSILDEFPPVGKKSKNEKSIIKNLGLKFEPF